MEFNSTKETETTTNFAGGKAFDPTDPREKLTRNCIAQLLENAYYRDDEDALAAIMAGFDEVADTDPEFVLKLASYCREEQGLRDVSQLLLVMSSRDERTQEYVTDYAPHIIQRADEPATCLAMNDEFTDGTTPSNPLKKAINNALRGFNEYEFGKYAQSNREWSMVDVFNVTHPTPKTEAQDELFEKVVRGPLDDYPDVPEVETPHTWETVISEKGNNAEAWREVLPDMGLFALIRNMRNMREAGLSGEEIAEYIDLDGIRGSKVLPFRYYQSYKALGNAGVLDDDLARLLSDCIDESVANLPDELESTYVAVDTSGSMTQQLSGRSDMTVEEIATLFGAVLGSKGADVGAFASEHRPVGIHPDAPALSSQDSIRHTNVGGSTNGYLVPKDLRESDTEYDRIILLSDMQLWDSYSSRGNFHDEFDKYRNAVNPDAKLYSINLASYPSTQMPDDAEGVYQFGGWDSSIIELIVTAEDTEALMNEIKAYSPA